MIWTFHDTGEAYDFCQCDSEIKDGDILLIACDRSTVGLAWTWPFALTRSAGKFHTVERAGGFPGDATERAAFEAGAKQAIAAGLVNRTNAAEWLLDLDLVPPLPR